MTTSAGTTNLSWDYEDRLTGITYPSTSTNSFTYNAFGARATKTDSSGTADYIRSGPSSGHTILNDGSATYTGTISERMGSATRYFHADGLSAIQRQTDTGQNTQSTRTWDAWGIQQSSSGMHNSPFGFGGGLGLESDPDSSLHYAGDGNYVDPSTGRFLRGDIFGTHRSGYSAAGNSPNGAGNRGGAPSGPQISGLIPTADGPTYRTGPDPRPEHHGWGNGRLGYFGGSGKRFMRELGYAGTTAAWHTFEIVGSVPLVGGVTSVVDDALNFVSRGSFRAKLAQLIGPPDFVADAHHVFPRKFAPRFRRLLIDIEHPKYGAWWYRPDHRATARLYNTMWQDFLSGDPTQGEALEFGRRIMAHFLQGTHY